MLGSCQASSAGATLPSANSSPTVQHEKKDSCYHCSQTSWHAQTSVFSLQCPLPCIVVLHPLLCIVVWQPMLCIGAAVYMVIYTRSISLHCCTLCFAVWHSALSPQNSVPSAVRCRTPSRSVVLHLSILSIALQDHIPPRIPIVLQCSTRRWGSPLPGSSVASEHSGLRRSTSPRPRAETLAQALGLTA